MIELNRGNFGGGDMAYIYKAVPELKGGGIFIEQWYFGGKGGWQGIKVDDDRKLIYSEVVSRGQGIPLGQCHFYGIAAQEKFYDEGSFLVNGSILTACKRRENFGSKVSSEFPPIKVGGEMPEKIISILAESEERVLETAKLLKLPLEEVLVETG